MDILKEWSYIWWFDVLEICLGGVDWISWIVFFSRVQTRSSCK